MAESNASFIPKNSNRVKKRVRTTRRIYILSYVSYVFFFGTLLAVLATYFYAIQVNTLLEDTKASLNDKSAQFSQADIEQVRVLEKKLITASNLLDASTAPSRIFDELEQVVAENIQFSGLSYVQEANGQFTVSLTGKADDFNQIIYQRDLMNRSPILESAEIVAYDYSIGLDEDAEANDGDTTNLISQLLIGDEVTLIFTFENTLNTAAIAYQPIITPVSSVSNENEVVSVRADAEEADEEVVPEAAVITSDDAEESVDTSADDALSDNGEGN